MRNFDLSIVKTYLPFAFLFCLLLIGAPFTMIEGDDAATLMFHLGDYDFSKYEPYAVYHVGYDIFLALLKKIVGSYYLSYTVCVVNVLIVVINLFFLIDFSKNYTNQNSRYSPLLILFLVLLAMPEFAYMSWVIGAPNLSLTFVLLALKILFNESKYYVVKVSLLLSLAITVRFDFVYSILLIPVFQMIDNKTIYLDRKIITRIVAICVSTATFAVFFILMALMIIHETNPEITGINELLMLIFSVFLMKAEWVEIAKEGHYGILTGAGINTIFTPIFLIISLLGFIFLFRKKDNLSNIWIFWLIVFVVLSQVFGWYYTFAGTIKRTLFLLPFIVIPFFVGLDRLFETSGLKQLIIFTILVLQTILGIQIKTNTTVYGPNMTLLNFKESPIQPKYRQLSLGFGSGFAFPTEEGLRPLLGFGKSFIDWPNLYQEISQKYSMVLLDTNRITLIDTRSKLFDYIMYKNDYILDMKEMKEVGDFSMELHRFRNAVNQTKIIISVAGGSTSWRAQTNIKSYKLIQNMCLKEFGKHMNYAWVYTTNRGRFRDDSNLLSYSPFTGSLKNEL